MPKIEGKKVHPPGTKKKACAPGVPPRCYGAMVAIMSYNPDRDFRYYRGITSAPP